MKTLLLALAAISVLATAATRESPFACDRLALNAQQRRRHFDELGPKLRELTTSARELPNGYEFEFPGDAATYQLAAEWVGGEHVCCPFFDIDLRLDREGGSTWIRLTGREGAKEFIRSDFARWFKQVGSTGKMK
jgi:hypothetical protein